jgi:enamine deaminase RidA (YjgF/YER057c/UK114 family)
MSGTVEARLESLGLELPVPAAPIANYVPFTRSSTGAGAIVFISGQIPLRDGKMQHVGKLGGGLSIEEGQEAAKLCALNILAQLKAAAGGDLDKVRRCLRLGGFVNCTPDFTNQPQVVNGASDLMVAVFGDSGKHARTAVGVPSLPGGVAVEVDAMFEVAD